MQLSEYPTNRSLQHMLKRIWKTSALSFAVLGEGVYGRCYAVTLGCFPYRVLVKIYKYPDIAVQERRQLIELHTHVPALVPHVYAYLEDPELGQALVMELLSGQSCPQPEQLPLPLRASLQSQVVDLLLHLHAIEHSSGCLHRVVSDIHFRAKM